MKRQSVFHWQYSGLKLFADVIHILEKLLNCGWEVLTIGKGTCNPVTEKNSDLWKTDQTIFFKAQLLCSLFVFNPWKSIFSSSSLAILALYIKLEEIFLFIQSACGKKSCLILHNISLSTNFQSHSVLLWKMEMMFWL